MLHRLIIRSLCAGVTSVFQQTSDNEFTVLGDLMKCAFTEADTCLKAVTLSLSKRKIVSYC